MDFATPHIAGYSVEGKLRGTQMILDATCEYFKMHSDWNMQDYLPEKSPIHINQNGFQWAELFNQHYRIENDYQALLSLSDTTPEKLATEFDLLRKNYPVRYEYRQFLVQSIPDKKIASQIERLLFRTE